MNHVWELTQIERIGLTVMYVSRCDSCTAMVIHETKYVDPIHFAEMTHVDFHSGEIIPVDCNESLVQRLILA